MKRGVLRLIPAVAIALACAPVSQGGTAITPELAVAPAETLPPDFPATALPPASIPAQCEGVPIATLSADTRSAETAPPIQQNPSLTAEQQQRVIDGLVNAVLEHYVYPEAAGPDWLAGTAETRARVGAGLETEAFYEEIKGLVTALGDEHSYFQTPVEVAEDTASIAGTYNFVGIGALFQPMEETDSAAVLAVFEGGSAWHAGLEQHDSLLAVDGGAIRETWGRSRTLGPECSAVVVTVSRPGGPPRDLTLIRAAVAGQLPIHPRLVPTSDGSKIGYIFLPTLLDESLPVRFRDALESFGPLDGLILDNRMNGGGLGSVSKALLGHFISGDVGDFVSREGAEALVVEADPVHNSQEVPLVVLVSENTVSYGEVLAGILQDLGRAQVVGQTTLGNVEQLRAYDFEDGSRGWLATATFDPANSQADWEVAGIVPDGQVIAAWDAFTFETDPAISAAFALWGR